MRGFSLLEVMLALTLAVTGITAGVLVSFSTPSMLEDARMEREAYRFASTLLYEAEQQARTDFAGLVEKRETRDSYTGVLSVAASHELLAARLIAHVSWKTVRGLEASLELSTVATNLEAAQDDACHPLFGDPAPGPAPDAAYRLSIADLLPGIPGTYTLADIVATRERLVMAVRSTSSTTDPTLFVFEQDASTSPLRLLQRTFDNAPTSRVGFVALARSGHYVYAANGFGSASTVTCGSGSCAQLQIFDTEALRRSGSLQLPRGAPTFAVSSGGIATPAKSIEYDDHKVYLGLEKTAGGSEFNIIDVSDPERPRLLGSLPVGRSVNAIEIVGHTAYLATSDPERELLAVDVSDPANPTASTAWDAPGTPNFGLGNRIEHRAGLLYFGRTYAPSAAEWFVFDLTKPGLVPVHAGDPGSRLRPESVNAFLVRGLRVFVLSGARLEIWDTDRRTRTAEHPLRGTGATMTCKGGIVYVGSNDAAGAGVLQVFTAS